MKVRAPCAVYVVAVLALLASSVSGSHVFASSGNLVVDGSREDDLSAEMTTSLTAGNTYYIKVTGDGNRTWSTNGYDDYGSLGEYTIDVQTS